MDVQAPADRVWARVTSQDGINHELLPWMKMTMPRGARGLTIDTFPLNTVIGKSWILLFGVIPVDYDELSIVELDPGRYFHEKSTMATMRHWEHERTIAPLDEGRTRITDRITLEPRFAAAAPLAARILHAFFGHRHRRLTRFFGKVD